MIKGHILGGSPELFGYDSDMEISALKIRRLDYVTAQWLFITKYALSFSFFVDWAQGKSFRRRNKLK